MMRFASAQFNSRHAPRRINGLGQQLVLSLALSLCCLPSFAADKPEKIPVGEQLADYPYRLPLLVAPQAGVVSLALAPEVYMNAKSADLADLRLFDADGKKIAFALHQPEAPARIESTTLDIKSFPLRGAAAKNGGNLALDIKTNTQGQVSSVKIKQAKGEQGAHALQALLLDLGLKNALQPPLLDKIHLSLPSGMQEYAAQVWLAVSDDLQHWDTIAVADLRWLNNAQGERLVQDEIVFPQRRFRYARLSWNAGTPIEFGKIYANGEKQQRAAVAMDSLVLPPMAGKFPQDLSYPTAIAIPIEKISLIFDEQNVVLPVEIGNYRELPKLQGEQKWEFQRWMAASFYQIKQDGQLRQSGEINLPPNHAAHLVLRRKADAIAKPHLKISWQSARLVFLTSGKAPYTLAFGRNDVSSIQSPLEEVAPGFQVDEIKRFAPGKFGKLQTYRAPALAADLATEASKSAQQRRYLLWAVLLAGVAIMALLVMRLFKQMKSDSIKQDLSQ